MKKLGLVSVLMTAMSFNAQADIEWSGFATIAGGIATGDDVIINPDLPTSTGADGYYDQFEFKPGTFFALQASSDLGEGLSATVQLMSRGSEDWDPKFTWAYMSYDVNDNFRILAGRQRLPLYAYSDYLDVSYAYHWITPPTEVYIAPFDSMDGVSAIYTHDMNSSSLTFQAVYGQHEDKDEVFSVNNVVGATATYNYDWLTLRLSHFELELEGGLTGDVTTNDVAILVDYSDWIVTAEYVPADLSKTNRGDKIEPWMVSVGKRINTFTPHVTVGKYKTSGNPFIAENSPYYIVGLRWDFHDSSALKFEYSGEEDAAGNAAQSFQIALVTVF